MERLAWQQAIPPLSASAFREMLGEETSQNLRFSKLEATATLIQPDVFTGYSPMYLALLPNNEQGLLVRTRPRKAERFILFRRYSYWRSSGFSHARHQRCGRNAYAEPSRRAQFLRPCVASNGLPTHKGRGLSSFCTAAQRFSSRTQRHKPKTVPVQVRLVL